MLAMEPSTSDTLSPLGANLPCAIYYCPNELLLMIGEYLDPLDLSALVQTATRFNQVLMPLLVRNIIQCTRWPGQNTTSVLIWAISKGHLDLAKYFMDEGKSLLEREEYRAALETAAAKGHMDIIKKILEHCPLNPSEDLGEPLSDAIVAGLPDIAFALIRFGATIKSRRDCESLPFGETLGAIHACACRGDIELLRVLIQDGVCPNQGDAYAWSPLHYAVYYGQVSTVEFLLNNGAEPCYTNRIGQLPFLMPSLSKQPSHMVERTENVSDSHKIIIDMILGGDNQHIDSADDEGMTALHWAAKNGFAELVDHLVDRGADVNICEVKGLTPLNYAIQNHHFAIAERLIAAGGSVSTSGAPGNLIIHNAAAQGYPIAAFSKLLALENLDPLALDIDGWTAIHHAAHCGSFDILDLLLQVTGTTFTLPENRAITLHGAIKKKDLRMLHFLLNAGVSTDPEALLLAIDEEYELVVQILLIQGADPDDGVGSMAAPYVTPLSKAVSKGSMQIVRTLLDEYADISQCLVEAESLLHLAIMNGHIDVLKFLLEAGADPNTPSTYSRGIIETAFLSGHESLVPFLIEKGAMIDIPEHDASTLSVLCWFGDRESTIKKLVEAGADVKCKDQYGNTVLHEIARSHVNRSSNTHIIQYLIKNGAEPSLVNQNKMSPLHLACQYGPDRDIWPFIKAGVDPALQDLRGWTAIHWAAWTGHFRQLSQLIDALKRPLSRESTIRNPPGPSENELFSSSSDPKSVINLKDINGWTALHVAVATRLEFKHDFDGYLNGDRHWFDVEPQLNNLEVINLLLESGADPSARDRKGRTPLGVALNAVSGYMGEFGKERLLNLEKVVERLKKAGARPGRAIEVQHEWGYFREYYRTGEPMWSIYERMKPDMDNLGRFFPGKSLKDAVHLYNMETLQFFEGGQA